MELNKSAMRGASALKFESINAFKETIAQL